MAYGLGIESSCDETSLAIVEDGEKLISLKIHSQIENHAPYRGVVPELASRAHLEKINPLLEMALVEANLDFKDLSYVSVTSHPGLMGSLLIGASLARCIALVHRLPIIPVNHLEAHLSVLALEGNLPTFPSLGVLLSGGNSSIYIYHGFGKLELIGDTMDDALGEAFDKVSSLLNLPYPGGPFIEKEANGYVAKTPHQSLFPKLLKEAGPDQIGFSFSGLKTAVMYHIKGNQEALNVSQICYDFQNSAFELVLRNVNKAILKTGIRNVIFAGGVLANETLRQRIEEKAKKEKWSSFFPRKKIYCTDNGAMVACLGYYLWKAGETAPIDFLVSPKRKLTK
ncbi:tRNA (adenosine(37)-N6)-threonylcarbamoyltransferase complex transferase subunit TsaD [Leptospira ognonensis]|uniref:tRNA N6-adenosine threonylcarbamoyltransferase n=1 Tax=Leptospira ognonensis TaxID=2484945 RepID=A0A4R9JYC1_9LEPT|nr:tRNA (adenosine(37)-N6)-threonylcarbamoyltransferase complex transferase subunit TsaD [Leptospira ognonensis]TGL58230.1 tRNA (adenosine(37)-N6)-threonylcarbamoyltransferase complex transferase subunit TsaD [Leptospira ognonensis]